MSLLALSLLFASTVQEPDLSVPVTYETAGKSTYAVLDDLSTLGKVKLDTVPATASDVLVIRVKDVPLQEVMTKIAKTTTSVWEKDGNMYRLVVDKAGRSVEAQNELKQRAKRIQEAIAEELKPPKEEGGLQAQVRMSATVAQGRDSAVDKVIKQILPTLNATTLGGIQPGGRIVYSSRPTRMQLALQANINGLVTEMVRQHNEEVEQRRLAEAGRTMTKEQEEMLRFAKMLGVNPDPQPITGTPSKALFVVSRNEMMGGLTLQFRLYDTNGRKAVEGSTQLDVGGGMFDGFMDELDVEFDETTGEMKPKQKPASTEKDKPIEFSAKTKHLQSFLKNLNPMMGGQPQKLPDDVRAILLRPDLHDPLSFMQGEAVLAIAKDKGVNVVANLPDSMMNFFSALMGGSTELTVNAFLAELREGRSTTGELANGWLTVKPKNPTESRRIRADRRALAQFIGVADKKGVPSLDDLAAFAMKTQPPMESPASMLYLTLFAPNTVNQGFAGPVNWDMLRLYGTLSSTQREGLMGGSRLLYATLSAYQREIVTKLMFGADAKLEVQNRQQRQEDDAGGWITMIRRFMPAQSNTLMDEPTEVMPNGLPPNGFATINVESSNFAKLPNDAGPMASMFGALGADELAMVMYMKDVPEMAQMAGFFPSMDKLRVGDRKTVTFRFFAAPNVTVTHSLQDDSIAADSPVVTLDQLPADFRARIEARVKAMKASPLPFGTFMGRGGAVPPPQP